MGVIYGYMDVVMFKDRCGDKLKAWMQVAWTTIGAWIQGVETIIGAWMQGVGIAIGAWFGAEGCMALCGNNGDGNGAKLAGMV